MKYAYITILNHHGVYSPDVLHPAGVWPVTTAEMTVVFVRRAARPTQLSRSGNGKWGEHLLLDKRAADDFGAYTRAANRLDAYTRAADDLLPDKRAADHFGAYTRAANRLDAYTRAADRKLRRRLVEERSWRFRSKFLLTPQKIAMTASPDRNVHI